MKILVTGSREWTDYDRMELVLARAAGVASAVFLGGTRSVNRMASRIAADFGIGVTEFAAEPQIGDVRPTERIGTMLVGIDSVISFQTSVGAGNGLAEAVVREAHRRGIETRVVMQRSLSVH